MTVDVGSGHATAPSIAKLRGGLLTARMILVRTVVATVTESAPDTAAAAGLSDAYQFLAALQGRHPIEVATALSYPHVGAWISRVLQRVREPANDAEPPVWADCAYLGWIAAAAGIACQPNGSMRLVVRNGVVMLPGIGMVRLGPTNHNGYCELRWTDTGALHFMGGSAVVHVSAARIESHPRWLPLRRVQGADTESPVLLDDLDPFRELASDGPTPVRLTIEQSARWQQDFAAAWELLSHELAHYLEPMRGCLDMLAPLSSEALVHSTSYTAYSGVGCVYTTAAVDPCQLALTLIHEVQHTKLNMLADQVLLLTPDHTARFYAPWRDDPRPIFGLLHGIYAFFGVCDFWRVHRNSPCHGSLIAHIDFQLGWAQVESAMTQVVESGLLTTAGHQLCDALARNMRSWASEYIPEKARLVASEVATAHRPYWRLRNLMPAADGITDLAARWTAGHPRPDVLPPAALIDQQRIPDRYSGLHLAAQLKASDTAAAKAMSSPDQPDGDRSYLAGHPLESFARYTQDLQHDPLRPQVWAGLALTLPKLFKNIDFGILQERAEVAAHLYSALGPQTPIVDLLRWLSNSRVDD
ncbi:HEXXH motif domain-containing protein [Nocardia sp. NPDC047038]|uniref:HEXXH motif domain-containing protein n=1 Tax=Nocardia sp. NPDC047038 TaxID=3154338 RepID=UPI0033D3EF21